MSVVWPHEIELCRLCRDDYRGGGDRHMVTRLSLDGMEATIYVADIPPPGMRSGSSLVLVCRGSDDMPDWVRNVSFLPIPGMGATRLWHRGFLREARVVHGFVVGTGHALDWVTGHSRGSAVAQILAASLGIPAVTFAAPRPLWLGPQPSHHWKVRNLCLLGDPVPHLGRFAGFRHVGSVQWVRGTGHRIATYLRVLEEEE